jgi:D-sedoheptulose 7-phosphate isomerase
MPKERMDLTLAARAKQFQELLAGCEFADASGSRLGLEDGIQRAMQQLRAARERNSSVYLVGNGGSAGIASHATTDFVNVARLRAQTIHDPSILTCMANDYGYENGFARILARLVRPGDVLVAISSSGKSLNIRNAADSAKQHGCEVMTLSGFERDNPLRSMGALNIWLDSRDYGQVEIGHQFILHNISDRFGHEDSSG